MANEYTLGGPPPQSRSEKILMNQNPGPAQSRIEELLKNSSGQRVSRSLVYKGDVETISNLPISENEVGDMYHVISEGSEWVWSGVDWEELGRDVYFSRISKTAQDTTALLDPNKLYVFPEMASLTITLATPTDNNVVNEYRFMFTSGATATTLTLPGSVAQPDGFMVEANHVYEVSILENCMTAQGWAVTA